jgi:hypothetical protein
MRMVEKFFGGGYNNYNTALKLGGLYAGTCKTRSKSSEISGNYHKRQ